MTVPNICANVHVPLRAESIPTQRMQIATPFLPPDANPGASQSETHSAYVLAM
jgi:hypothetical protein